MNCPSVVWVGVGLTLIGCGGGSPAKTPTVTEACAAYASKLCGDIQSCAPGLMSFFGYSVLADCVSTYQSGCETASSAPQSGYTASRIQSCANAYANNKCAEFLSVSYPSNCVPRGGTIADGGSCVSDWQCASTRCSAAPNQCGTCVARIARAAACDPADDRCAVNLACAPAAVGSTSYVCTPPAAVGSACTDSVVCPIDTYCEPDTHVCTVLPKLGEACDPRTMFFCELTGPSTECDSASSTCVAGPTPVPVGTSCDAADHGLTTDTSCVGNCVGGGDGGLGICQPRGQAGEDCALGELCATGLACVNGVCGTCGGSTTTAAAHRTLGNVGARTLRSGGAFRGLAACTPERLTQAAHPGHLARPGAAVSVADLSTGCGAYCRGD